MIRTFLAKPLSLRTGAFVSRRKALSRLAFGLLAPLLGMSMASADVVPPKIEVTSPTGVSVADREYRISSTDLAIGSLKLERFSQSPSRYWVNYSQFGIMMTSGFDIYVQATFIKAAGPTFYTAAHYHNIVHIGNSSYGTYYSQTINGTGTISSH